MPFIDLNPPSGGGGPSAGDATVTFSAICLSSDTIGDVVYISADKSGSFYEVAKVDIFTTTKMPAIGIIIQKLTSTTCIVLSIGEVVGLYTGLTPNSTLFADLLSRLSESAPSAPLTGIALVQAMARSLSSDTILVNTAHTPTVRVSG